MKKIFHFKNSALSLGFLLMSGMCFGQNIVDTQWGFKLNIPSTWSKNIHMDGNDKVYDFYSSDQNAAVQLRIFSVTPQVTYKLLIPLYEQKMLASAKRVALQDILSKNGISGKQGIYSMSYNSSKVDIAIFYTLQNKKAYILSALVASSVAENYRADLQSISASFKINGAGNNPSVPKTGLGGLGGRIQSQYNGSANNSSVVGRYKFDYSSGDNRTNFNNIYLYRDGTFKHEYQPKNSGDYIGRSKGTWKLSSNTLYLTHRGGDVVDTYFVSGRKLIRTTPNGSMVYFKE